jgi:hypothetical protein
MVNPIENKGLYEPLPKVKAMAPAVQLFISQVYAKPEYKVDPRTYIIQWEIRRGHSEAFNTIEDPALEYFQSIAANPNDAKSRLECFKKS